MNSDAPVPGLHTTRDAPRESTGEMDVAVEPATPAELTAREKRLTYAASRRIEGLHCVLEGLEDRGNRAAVLRTVEALGLLHVHEVAPSQPERGRARGVAHGGEKWLMMHTHASPAECRAALPGVTLLAALPPLVSEAPASASWHQAGRKRKSGGAGARDASNEEGAPEQGAAPERAGEAARALGEPAVLEEVDFSKPTALVFGNERHGLSAAMVAACDGAFYVPLHGLTESLNVSVAAAISVHFGRVARVAALRQQGKLNAQGGDLSEAQVEALLEDYRTRGKHHAKST